MRSFWHYLWDTGIGGGGVNIPSDLTISGSSPASDSESSGTHYWVWFLATWCNDLSRAAERQARHSRSNLLTFYFEENPYLSILCRLHSVETYLPFNAYKICFNFIIVWIRLQTPRYREELNIQSPPPLPQDCFYAGVTPSLATLLSRHESYLIHENLPKFFMYLLTSMTVWGLILVDCM